MADAAKYAKATLANIILIITWTAPLGLLPASVLLITYKHGLRTIVLGFVLMAVLLGGSPKWPFRLSIYVYLVAVALSAGSFWALVGAAGLGVMLVAITERPGGPTSWSPNPSFCKLITETLDGRGYYARCELIGAVDKLKPGQRVLLCAHPHGMLTAGWTWNMFWNWELHERTGRIGFLLDEGLRLKSPTFRLMCDWYAGPKRWAGAATKDVMKEEMSKGGALALLPGGFQEATICKRGAERVYIRSRKGFIKYCLQEGYAVVPCYTFGESDTYTAFCGLLGPRLALAKRNIPAVAMAGNPLCPLLPHTGVSLVTAVGEALALPKIEEPDQRSIDEWHAKYVEALRATFDTNKAAAGKADAVLEIW